MKQDKNKGVSATKPNYYLGSEGRDLFDTVEEFFPSEGVRTKYVSMIWEYTYRAEFKNGIQDLLKAREVIDRYIEYLEKRELNDCKK